MAEERIGSTSSAAKTPRSPLHLPPLASLPGLGQAEAGKDKPQGPKFRDSDSPYVRLSKMGGHKDLLTMEESDSTPKQSPAPYKRNQWYYHLDNAKEDAAEQATPRYQPAIFIDEKEFLPKIDTRADAQGLPLQSAGSSKKGLKAQLPPGGFPKVVPHKPPGGPAQKKGRTTLTYPRLYSRVAAKRRNHGMTKQPDWKREVKAHYKKLQTTPPRTFQPISEYEYSFGSDLFNAKLKDNPRTSVSTMLELAMETDPLPFTTGYKGFAAAKKSAECDMVTKFKNVTAKLRPGKKTTF